MGKRHIENEHNNYNKNNTRDLNPVIEKILSGYLLEREEAILLSSVKTLRLQEIAEKLRKKNSGDSFEFCAIINAKSGRCSEDCQFCAQSGAYQTEVSEYDLVSPSKIRESAQKCADKGISRLSLVTSGRRLSDKEIDIIAETVSKITGRLKIGFCVSIGLTTDKQYRILKDAGVTRVHNNLETSRRFFPQICSTHSYDDKISAIKRAKNAGFEICTGGIIGLGETMEDRIDLALEARRLGAVSMPVNVFSPIPGTPLAAKEILTIDEVCKTIALFKIINPEMVIRMAGGRNLLPENGAACFESGATAAITGDMLTTEGALPDYDRMMVEKKGFCFT